MKITHCKLLRKQQLRLLEYFVLEVTARSAADMLGIQTNTAMRVLRKYNGIPKESFPLFLKECEFRFNYGTPKQQLKILKEWAGI